MIKRWTAPQALIAAILAAALVASAFSSRADSPASADPFPAASPESVGVSAADLQSICGQIQKWVDDEDAVGAEIHIIKNRRTVLHKGFGWMDRENKVPMKPDSIFCVRSMTKPVVGAAIQILVDEGKIAIDDPAAKYLPSFDNDKSRAIMIRHLLNHTSGLPLTLKSKGLGGYADIREIAAEAGEHGPDFPPGSGFHYSDEGADALGAIVEQVSGRPLDEFVRTRLLEPVGMKDAMCVLKPGDERWSRISCNYMGTKGNWQKYWDNTKTDIIFPIFLASQGLYCSTTDYARFLALWMDMGKTPAPGGERILSEDAVRRAVAPAVPFNGIPTSFDGCEMNYGQNWMIYKQAAPTPSASSPAASSQAATASSLPMFGHGGSDGTYALAVPDRDLIVLYFTQSRGGTTALSIESVLRPLIGQPPLKQPAAAALTAQETEPYLGFYYVDVLDEIGAVIRHGSQLALEIPSQQEFVLRWPDEQGKWAFDLLPSIAIKFDQPEGGRVPGFTIFQAGQEHRAKRYEPAADLPRADDLIALRHRAAGAADGPAAGDDPFKGLRNVRLTGQMHVPQRKLDGTFSLLVAGADRYLANTDFGKVFERTAVQGGHVWSASAGVPPAEQQGVFRDQKLRAFQPYRLGGWHDLFKDITVLRRTTVNDEPAIEVRAAAAEGSGVRIYVSEKTGLTLRELTLPTVKGFGAIPTATRYEDHRDVGGGVMLPFRIVSENKLMGEATIQFEKVETNADLPEDAFDLK